MSPPTPRRKAGSPVRGGGPSPGLIGISIIVLIVALTYFAFHKGPLPLTHPHRVSGLFSTSSQLRQGSPVRIAGVDVGEVQSIAAGPGRTTMVKMTITDLGQPLHTDATMRIRPRVFLEGGFYVQLDPGSPSAPKLRNDGTIPLPQTSVPVQLSQVLSTFTRPTRNGLKNVLNTTGASLQGGGAQGLRAAIPQLKPTLRDLTWTAQAAQGTQPDELSTLLGSTSRVTSALASNETELADLVTNLNRTSTALAAADGALGASVRELDGVLRTAPGALSALHGAIPAVLRFGTAIRPALPLLPPLIDRASDVLVQFAAIVRPPEFRRILAALSGALIDVPNLLRQLGGVFPTAKPVVDCLRTRVLPVLYSSVPDGALSTGRPVWQDFAHSVVGLSSASQGFDGNGYALRYLSGVSPQSISTGGLPIIGKLLGQGPSSTSSPAAGGQGASPHWLGDGVLPPFRPDQSCLRQPLVHLGVVGSGASRRGR